MIDEKFVKLGPSPEDRRNSNPKLNVGLEAASEYIEILERHISNLESPSTVFRGYIGPHARDIAKAKGKWCAKKAIMYLAH